jgi:type IV pilus assembly protein PilB
VNPDMLHQNKDFTLAGLAGHLVYADLLEPTVAAHAVEQAKKLNLPLTSYLVANNIVASKKLVQTCAKIFDLPIVDLNHTTTIQTFDTSELELIRRYHVMPLNKKGGQLFLGVTDPTDQTAIDAMRFHSGLRISLSLIEEDQLNAVIAKYSDTLPIKNYLELKDLSVETSALSVQESAVNYDEPLIKFVDDIIQHALQKSASDIHIEPYETHCRIRYRQDGILYEITEIANTLASRLVTRLKVMARLDISERRLPQDGRFQLQQTQAAIDIRINTCPTLFGEKIVLRLLDVNKLSLQVETLGFTPSQKKLFLKKIAAPQGLILVTGPTGSGKTVTLYSALHHLNTAAKNISTVEDPVEIQLGGINQININPKIGLSFSSILRTLLRQDPDIIMVGEIRDSETAEIAIQAAQTGHLVFSTLHTNNAIETLSRLHAMNIASYNLVNSLSLIIAQRLIRKLCRDCKIPENVSAKTRDNLGIPSEITLYTAIGCQHCLQGYQGRIGIYEFLPMTRAVIDLMIMGASNAQILQQAAREGFCNLRQAGIQKAIQGVTSLSEINRVIHE